MLFGYGKKTPLNDGMNKMNRKTNEMTSVAIQSKCAR